MTTVGEVFVCKRCGEAITSTAGRPETCPGCGARLGNKSKNNRFRVGSTPFHQFYTLMDKEKARPTELKKTPEETDTQFAQRKKAEMHVRAKALARELSEFIMDMPVSEVLRVIDYAEYLVEHCAFFDKSTVRIIETRCKRMAALAENVAAGQKMGVIYADNATRSTPGLEDKGNS